MCRHAQTYTGVTHAYATTCMGIKGQLLEIDFASTMLRQACPCFCHTACSRLAGPAASGHYPSPSTAYLSLGGTEITDAGHCLSQI